MRGDYHGSGGGTVVRSTGHGIGAARADIDACGGRVVIVPYVAGGAACDQGHGVAGTNRRRTVDGTVDSHVRQRVHSYVRGGGSRTATGCAGDRVGARSGGCYRDG